MMWEVVAALAGSIGLLHQEYGYMRLMFQLFDAPTDQVLG